MGKEQEIPIETKGQYKNIKPKQDLEPTNYIVCEKLFAEGKRIEKTFTNKDGTSKDVVSYSVGVRYNNEDVSFFVKEHEHDDFVATGEVGDLIKVTCVEKTATNPRTKTKMIYNGVEFSKNE